MVGHYSEHLGHYCPIEINVMGATYIILNCPVATLKKSEKEELQLSAVNFI
jgi:hypothetical protein